MRAVGSPRRARTVLVVPAHWSSRPAPRSRRARNQGARLTLRQRASSIACSFVRGPRPLALRTSSWWTKYSLRLGSRRTHPMRKKPGGGPDRIVAMSHVKSLCASALLRRSAKRPHVPGRTSPGPARWSRSRRTRCAARSRVVHGARRVGASGPSSSNRSLSCARSTVSKSGSAISPECKAVRLRSPQLRAPGLRWPSSSIVHTPTRRSSANSTRGAAARVARSSSGTAAASESSSRGLGGSGGPVHRRAGQVPGGGCPGSRRS